MLTFFCANPSYVFSCSLGRHPKDGGRHCRCVRKTSDRVALARPQVFNMTSAVDFRLIRREFVAGGTAGGIGIFMGFPFDLIKVNLQTHPDKYKSAWQCFRQIVKSNGYMGLYRGCIPPVMMQGLINSLIFTGESVATKMLEPNLRPGEVASPFNSFLAGSAGGLLQCVILVPSEVIKCTMQAGSIPASALSSSAGNTSGIIEAFKPTLDTVRYIHRTEGIRGLYKGLGVTCLREIPAIGIYFFSYKNIRAGLHKLQGGTAETKVSTPATLVAGALAGALSWLLLYPIDVIKTNMQASVSADMAVQTPKVTQVHAQVPVQAQATAVRGLHTTTSSAVSSASVAYSEMSFWQVGLSLYKQRGIAVFFNGIGTAVFRALPVNALIFYIYEHLKDTEMLRL